MITPSVAVLFVFNRADEASRVLLALRNQTVCPPKLLVFSDGARNPDDGPKVSSVRSLIRSIDWIDVEIREREHNYGCASNIIEGLSEVFQSYDRAAILEDDTLPAPRWYESMCLMLRQYADQPSVFSVGGYPSIKADVLPGYPYDVLMSPRFSCWGWGTWADRWHLVKKELQDFKNPFSGAANVPLHAGSDLRAGAVAVERRPGFYWDIPVAILCLQRGMMHAITRYYLVHNIGTDSGTHGTGLQLCVLEFLEKNNCMEDRLPVLFPPASVRDDVSQAVQEFVQEVAELARRKHPVRSDLIRRLKGRLRAFPQFLRSS